MTMMASLLKSLSDIGFQPSLYGPAVASFMTGVAVGNVAGGWLVDCFSVRSVISLSLVGVAIPLLLLPVVSNAPILSVACVAAGSLIGASHSTIVVQTQHMMPGRTEVASRLMLGFTFASGLIGIASGGYLADLLGFQIVFSSLAFITTIAGGIAASLKIFKDIQLGSLSRLNEIETRDPLSRP